MTVEVEVTVPVSLEDWMCNLTLADFESMDIIESGWTSDLYIHDFSHGNGHKVWLSRVGIDGGMPYDNAVIIEKYVANRWVDVLIYEAL